MKNNTQTKKLPQRRIRELTQRALASVTGGHDGTIIVENAIPDGIQGSG